MASFCGNMGKYHQKQFQMSYIGVYFDNLSVKKQKQKNQWLHMELPYTQSCWTDPDTSVVSLPWPVIMYHIILCIWVQVLLYWVVSVFWTHPSPLYVPWLIYFYIDQGQGRGLGSSDRTLTGAGKNILSNL